MKNLNREASLTLLDLFEETSSPPVKHFKNFIAQTCPLVELGNGRHSSKLQEKMKNKMIQYTRSTKQHHHMKMKNS
jgi:hypothetical protein